MHEMSADPSALNARWRAFQLRLADQLKALSSPTAIVETATRLLAGYLGASHCWYTEVGASGDTFFSRAGWFGAGIPPMPTSGRIDDFGPAVVATLVREATSWSATWQRTPGPPPSPAATGPS